MQYVAAMRRSTNNNVICYQTVFDDPLFSDYQSICSMCPFFRNKVFFPYSVSHNCPVRCSRFLLRDGQNKGDFLAVTSAFKGTGK